jgi:hypothetical protein
MLEMRQKNQDRTSQRNLRGWTQGLILFLLTAVTSGLMPNKVSAETADDGWIEKSIASQRPSESRNRVNQQKSRHYSKRKHRETNRNYSSGRQRGIFHGGKSEAAQVAKSTQVGKASAECGDYYQKMFHPSQQGGKSLCARSVRHMVACVNKQVTGSSNRCTAASMNCGPSAKNYLSASCAEKFRNCGYEKHSGQSSLCEQPGAVRVHERSPTRKGKIHGHIEMVGEVRGRALYYSIYRGPLNSGFPGNPDACFFPKNMSGGGGQ